MTRQEETREYNFDGLVGPSHNYSGLAYGNTASMQHGSLSSNPREAALQGLLKMRMLMEMGIPQGVLCPQERPNLSWLRRIGFEGSDESILAAALHEAPQILSACSSAASMWTANAATVTPSVDSKDHRLHLTAANLCSQLHRSMEAKVTDRILRRIFADERFFVIHDPLPAGQYFADEGAANHTRLAASYGKKGIHLFTYGRKASQPTAKPERYPARQTIEASQAISRLHQVDPICVVYAQQLPAAIDAGVFHNDVIAVGNESFFFYHEKAYIKTPQVIQELKDRAKLLDGTDLTFHEVLDEELSLEEAVKTYLFNSQIVTQPNHQMVLIAPKEAEESFAVQRVIKKLLASDSPVKEVRYADVHQSMQNGGGPACLRIRVVLTPQEAAAINQGVILTEDLYQKLVQWIRTHYRDVLSPADLADPHLLQECRTALDELTRILGLGPIYDFQR